MSANLYPGYSPGGGPQRVQATADAQSTGADAPWVLGVAGGGLVDADWAANADVAAIGRKGELRTAGVLDPLSSAHGAAVLHDLRIPVPGFAANIDHAVVSGNHVLLVDSKAWAPGFFWTFAGHTHRGFKSFDSADKRTMVLAAQAIERYLASRHLGARVDMPLVAVWPTNTRKHANFWALRFPGAAVVRGERLHRRVRRFIGRKTANALVVSALSELLKAPTRRPGPTVSGT